MHFDTEKLISLKENFTGQKFQWIKTDRPELLGKVVKCRDVEPTNDGRFFVIFDDQSKVDSTKLNSNLMMIHGDEPPLSKDEVFAIYGHKLQQPSVQAKVQPVNQSTTFQHPPQNSAVNQQPPVQNRENMFSMFNSEEFQMNILLNVKLPDKKLLKMMYANAENKEKFLNELSDYLQSMINKSVIKESMKLVLEPQVTQRSPKASINLTEVNE